MGKCIFIFTFYAKWRFEKLKCYFELFLSEIFSANPKLDVLLPVASEN